MPRRVKGIFSQGIWIALGAATIWLILAWLAQTWQPILADEWDFYRAITHWPVDRVLIPHPQGYVHLAQVAQALLGVSTTSVRFVGLTCALLSVWLIPWLTAAVYPDRRDRSALTILAIVLTALSPFVIQNSLLIDIDNTVLIPATLLILIAWATLQTRSARLRFGVLSLLVAFALWFKLPTPPLVMGALFLFHLLRAEWKRAVELVGISLAGLLLFAITFELYTLFSGYQWSYFGPTFARSNTFFDLPLLAARFPQGLGVFILWLTLPVTLLLAVIVIQTLRRLFRRQLIIADALTIYVSIIAIFYPLVYVPAWGYPRYQAPLVPVIMTLIAAQVMPYLQGQSRRRFIGLAALLIGLCAFDLFILPDPLYPIYTATFEGGTYDLATRLAAAIPAVAIMSVPIVLVLVAGWLIERRGQRVGWLMVLLLVLSGASMLSLSLVQMRANYSTRYRYTYDFADYAWSVQQARALGPAAYILAIKDTLNESGIPGEEVYPYLLFSDHRPSLREVLVARRVDALIWTDKEAVRAQGILSDPQLTAILQRCYDRDQRGVFQVYRLKPGVVCQ
jgi:hypothetical protein